MKLTDFQMIRYVNTLDQVPSNDSLTWIDESGCVIKQYFTWNQLSDRTKLQLPIPLTIHFWNFYIFASKFSLTCKMFIFVYIKKNFWIQWKALHQFLSI